MRRIYISTVNRVNEENVTSIFGHLYVLDWDTGELLNDLKQEVESDISIGKSKGARGIVFHNNKIYVANSLSAVTVYDADIYKILNHKIFDEVQVVHQMKYHKDLIHIVSTSNDQVVRVDEDLNLISVDKVENRDLVPCKEWVNDKLHFNSIAWLSNGDEIHIYNGLHMVYNFTKKEIIYKGSPLHSPHDVVLFEDGSLIINSSADFNVVQIKNSEANIIYSVPKQEVEHINGNQWGYTRGLTTIGNKVFACNSPMRIVELESLSGIFKIKKKIEIDKGSEKSIYDICLDPRDWHEDLCRS